MKPRIIPPPVDELKIPGPEVARRLGVDPATVRRWRRLGMPSYPLTSKLILFKMSEVQAWLESGQLKIAMAKLKSGSQTKAGKGGGQAGKDLEVRS
jgi:Helix-turn-helix domain